MFAPDSCFRNAVIAFTSVFSLSFRRFSFALVIFFSASRCYYNVVISFDRLFIVPHFNGPASTCKDFS